MPAFRASSIILQASTTGRPISMIWTVRNRLRSSAEVSTRSTTAIGFSSAFSGARTARVTISSCEYAVREYVPGRSTMRTSTPSMET